MVEPRPNIIDRLTDKQHSALKQFGEHWSSSAWFTSKVDKPQAESAVSRLYRQLGLDEPQIFWCQSPFQLAVMPQLLRLVLWTKLSANDRWNMVSQLKARSRTSSAPLPMIQLWLNLNAQLDRNPVSQIAADPGVIINDRITSYLFKMMPDVLSQLSDAMNAEIQSHLDVSLRGGLRLAFEDFRRNMERARFSRTLSQSFSAGLNNELKTSVSQLIKEEDAGATSGFSLASINLTAQLDTWLTKFQRSWWGPWEIYWLAMYEFARKELDAHIFDSQANEFLDLWLAIARGGTAYLFFEHHCFISEHPLEYNLDANHALHSEHGPAIAFADHQNVYALRGVTVPADVIEDPSSLTPKRIERESNLEVKRVMIERYGPGKFILDGGAAKIHEDKFGVLYRKDLGNDEPLVMVKVANSTPEPDGSIRNYFIRVPPTTRTAREGVAWTFGFASNDYKPEKET